MREEEHKSLFLKWLEEHGSSVMKAWQSLPKFEGKASVATWFYRVALHTAMNWHRKEKPRRLRQQPSITATMIARLVESGQMQWSDTLSDCFPDKSIHEDWKSVTLMQLLTDTAGAPLYFPSEVMRKRELNSQESALERREAVLNMIAQKPLYTPGTKYVYSCVGFTIAAAMAEKVTDTNWEQLVRREVFEPLDLTSAGFGPPRVVMKN